MQYEVLSDPTLLEREDDIILFVGPTGAGKSNMIDKLLRRNNRPGSDRMTSHTSQVQAARVKTQRGNRIVLIDTPGFNDTTQTNFSVLEIIAKWLLAMHEAGLTPLGVLYFHRITDPPFGGTAMQIQNMFSQLCGTDAAKNVVFVTTMWDCPDPSHQNNKTEKSLKTDYWRNMILQQARVARFLNNEESAWRIVKEMIFGKCVPGIPLELQVELASGVALEKTKAALELQDSTRVIEHPSPESIDVDQSILATPSSSQFITGPSYLNPSLSASAQGNNATSTEEYISGDTSHVQVKSSLSNIDVLEPSHHRRVLVEPSFADQSGPHLHQDFSEVPGSLFSIPTTGVQSPHSTNTTPSQTITSTVPDYLGPIDSIPTSDLRDDHLGDHAQSASTSFSSSSSILHRQTDDVQVNVLEVHTVEDGELGRQQRDEHIQGPIVNDQRPPTSSDEISAVSKRSGSTITIMGSSKSSAEVPSGSGETDAESRPTQMTLANTDGSLQNPATTSASEREFKTHESASELVNGRQDSSLQDTSMSTSRQENVDAVPPASTAPDSTLPRPTEGSNVDASLPEQRAPDQRNAGQLRVPQTDASVLEDSKHAIVDHPTTTPGKSQSNVSFWKKVKNFLTYLCCCK